MTVRNIPPIQSVVNVGNTLIDNSSILFGTTNQGSIYHNGTRLVIDSNVVGSGALQLGNASGDGVGTSDLLLDQIGLGGSPINSFFWINFLKTTNLGRGALFFDYTYTGAGPQANVLSYPTYNGSSANVTCFAYQSRVRDLSDPSGANCNYITLDSQIGTPGTQTITQGTKHYIGARFQHNQGVGVTNTGGIIRQYGIQQLAFPLYVGVASNLQYGAYFENDVGVLAGTKIGYEDTSILKGDTYDVYNSTPLELERWVNGVETQGNSSTAVNFYVPPRRKGISKGVVTALSRGWGA